MIHGTDISTTASGMTLHINVKLPKGLLKAGEFDRLLAKYTGDIAREVRDFWMAAAGRRLKSSRKRYQDSIMLEGYSASSFGFRLSLSDPLAVAVETGAPGFDMKPGLMGMVVPMNLDKNFTGSGVGGGKYAATFRHVNPHGRVQWRHPGFEARNIIDDVITETLEVIIPKYVQKIVVEMIA